MNVRAYMINRPQNHTSTNFIQHHGKGNKEAEMTEAISE
jgi:hypothetical protein